MKNKASSSEAVERFFADFDLGSTDHVSSGDSYFDSHNQKESYEELLNDEVHQEAYRRAILANKDLFTDRIILVVGCGLGSAPYVVAEAGAKMVLAQERNQVSRYVPEIARLNDYENIINVRGDVNDPGFTLPYAGCQVDIIVSEPMSYLLLHESRIRDVIVARERFLKPGGKMFPNRFTMHLCAVAAPQEYTMWKEFWQDIGGFDFSE
ncbi:protein arginine methyltransferase, putative [Perkinsus marinus ATCC 50983]|uniref:Protein arginine methyltransferase, putative n=1 Tax=Perkinsus marinus (strain ATCC 50983 / TXsc) TaxID=423536 RepID=C5KJU1_PERM5|nr:protein arginine methyltransferase, putative [Perkinsus marinus ATCC 50983]EER15199.1 protein arginine methyltransferase, putative [Perkinsus marinus ATCC 50983]|eukprot:XP_002783403.1 protein arginine methyltransferase, putative [Perkinsus marinus ATCC 50983]